jgi:hypothetical protein
MLKLLNLENELGRHGEKTGTFQTTTTTTSSSSSISSSSFVFML